MLVSALLQSKGSHVVEIGPEAEVRGIADTLRREGIGAVLVRQADGEMLGIVSERDIVHSVAEHGPDALNKSASDLMSRSVVTCGPDNSTEELMEQMLAERIRHVPVYRGDVLLGIISIGDVVNGVLSELKWRETVLRDQLVTAVGWSTDEE